MSEAKTVFNDLAKQMAVLPGGGTGQMFGMPVAKVNGKAFMGFFQEDIILKLDTEPRKEALPLTGAHLFDPMGSGRVMKEWVQIPFEYVSNWGKLASHARNYVLQLTVK
jgi:hypothetical protein